MIETLSRTAAVIMEFMGAKPFAAFSSLIQVLTRDLQPALAGHLDTTISVNGAIDITNSVIYKVAHDPNLQHCKPEERWDSVVANVLASKEYTVARINQQRANTLATMTTIAQSVKGANPNNGNRNNLNNRNAKRKANVDTDTPNTPPNKPKDDGTVVNHQRCRKQDDKPDGCPFGIKCKFEHDDANPKVGTPRPNSRNSNRRAPPTPTTPSVPTAESS